MQEKVPRSSRDGSLKIALDLGTFSCMVTNTEGFSSSYTLTEEGESHTHATLSSLIKKCDIVFAVTV